jgi:ABC-type nitrate/sulfonate/bicarbonate transport system ATPase subunit
MTPRPEILLLDEPFTALDAPTRRGLQNMLLELKSELSVSMMFVTHDIREAVYLADRLLIMTSEGVDELDINLSGERDEFSDEFVKIERKVYALISPDKS